MTLVIRWSFFIGLFWLIALAGIAFAMAAGVPDPQGSLRALNVALISWGPGLGRFIAGPLSLAIILHVLLNVAEKFGFDKITASSFRNLTKGFNVQAGLAVILIVAFAIAALSNVGDVVALKDIALVVVGFYFGDRKRSGELEDVAHTAALTAVGASESGVPQPNS